MTDRTAQALKSWETRRDRERRIETINVNLKLFGIEGDGARYENPDRRIPMEKRRWVDRTLGRSRRFPVQRDKKPWKLRIGKWSTTYGATPPQNTAFETLEAMEQYVHDLIAQAQAHGE